MCASVSFFSTKISWKHWRISFFFHKYVCKNFVKMKLMHIVLFFSAKISWKHLIHFTSFFKTSVKISWKWYQIFIYYFFLSTKISWKQKCHFLWVFFRVVLSVVQENSADEYDNFTLSSQNAYLVGCVFVWLREYND